MRLVHHLVQTLQAELDVAAFLRAQPAVASAEVSLPLANAPQLHGEVARFARGNP